MSRDVFAREALAAIPKLLTLLDRNPHSPTYGCFDRNYWHYKIIDFPSGMAQEFVWPLALAHEADVPGNRFHRQPVLRDWVAAAILFAARSAHPDGSCDDYFPYERASGAAAFSLLACIESYRLLGLDLPEAREFFARRADWLAGHEESGRLSNHQALIALCLERMAGLLETSRWDRARDERVARVLAWQSAEGWFPEYEGCDPGYHTLTLSCLAAIHEARPDEHLRASLEKAVGVTAELLHPDGSYGGEYASRNTYNFFPHGFEWVGRWLPGALSVNDRFLDGLARGLVPCYADDHILGHHLWSYLLAWRHWVPDRPAPRPRRAAHARTWLRDAQLLIDRREGVELYLALNKGGVFKLFRNDELAASDTQVSLRVGDGRRARNAVAHLVGPYQVEVGDDEITISGDFGWAKQTRMTPLRSLLLRSVMLTVGRFFPDLVRRGLQRLLITGKRGAPYRFVRRLRWQNAGWHVRDEVRADSWEAVSAAGIGADQTSIYVVMSRTFHPGQLRRWLDLTEQVRRLSPGEPLVVERQL